MTDKKYTNEEIEKALSLCGRTTEAIYCDQCPLCGEYECIREIKVLALDLINRQKAEIERLKKEVNLVSILFQDVQERTEEYRLKIENFQNVISNQQIEISVKIEKQIKAEAYREFAEKLENEINCRTTLSREQDKNVIHIIHNLLKEMVGEEE